MELLKLPSLILNYLFLKRQKERAKFGEVLESNGTKVNLKNKIIKILSEKKLQVWF